MRIEDGWRFYSADFSLQASGLNNHTEGFVTLKREREAKNRWHKLAQSIIDSDDCPELYVTGGGMTIEEAIVNANFAASHAKEIK